MNMNKVMGIFIVGTLAVFATCLVVALTFFVTKYNDHNKEGKQPISVVAPIPVEKPVVKKQVEEKAKKMKERQFTEQNETKRGGVPKRKEDIVTSFKFTVPVGTVYRYKVPKNYDWGFTRDPSYSSYNRETMVYVVVNGNLSNIQKSGLLNRVWHNAYFSKTVASEVIEVTSKTVPAHLIMNLTWMPPKKERGF